MVAGSAAQAQDIPRLSFPTNVGKPVVGKLGDPDRLVLYGVTSFQEQEIVSALMKDPEVIIASHPTSYLDEYIMVVEEGIRQGYLHSGCPDVQVEVSKADASEPAIEAQITEGACYTAGDVIVRGAQTIPVDDLVGYITEEYQGFRLVDSQPFLDSLPEGFHVNYDQSVTVPGVLSPRGAQGETVGFEDSVWVKASPAPFDKPTRAEIEWRVAASFAAAGYPDAEFDVSFDIENSSKTAQLVIDVIDEGKPSTIGSISIDGNIKNSSQEIIELLGVEVGQLYNWRTFQKLENALWNSARFFDYAVESERGSEGGSGVDITVNVTEYEPAPPLSVEFSVEQKALLKTRKWVLDTLASGYTLDILIGEIEEEGLSNELVALSLSPEKAILEILTRTGDSSAEMHAMVELNAEKALVYSFDRNLFFEAEIPDGYEINLDASFLPSADAARQPGSEQLMQMWFGARLDTSSAGASRSLFNVNLSLAPVTFLDLLTDAAGEAAAFWDGDNVEISWDYAWINLNAETGELHELFAANHDVFVLVSIVADGVSKRSERLAEEIEANEPQKQNGSLISLAAFLLEESIALGLAPRVFPDVFSDLPFEQRQAAANTLNRIIGDGALHPLEALIGKLFPTPSLITFDIPARANLGIAGVDASVSPWAFSYAFRAADEVFLRDTWPWTLAQGSVLIGSERHEQLDATLQHLFEAGDMGPIGFFSTAKLLQLFDSPIAVDFALNGLHHNSPNWIKKDLDLLLLSETPLAKSLLEISNRLYEIEDAEFALLAAALSPTFAPKFREVAGIIRHGVDSTKGSADQKISLAFVRAGKLRSELEALLGAAANISQAEAAVIAGWGALHWGEPDLAQSDFERAVAHAPSKGEGFWGRATARCQLGDFEGTVEDIIKTIELGVTSARDWQLALKRQGHYEGDLDGEIGPEFKPAFVKTLEVEGCNW